MTDYQYTEKENPLMNMSIDDLSYVLKLRRKMGDLESALNDIDDRFDSHVALRTYESDIHSSEVTRIIAKHQPPGTIRLNLPTGKANDPEKGTSTHVEIWVSPDTQKKLIRAEMLKIKTEMLLHVGPNDQVEQVDVVE